VPSFRQHVDTLDRWRRFPGLERLEPPGRRVALTLDDGPDPDATPAVLEALAEAGVRATFFLVGEQLQVHHELGGEVARAGHEVALHGLHHVEHDELDDPRDDLLRGLDAVEAATGTRPRLFRPPYGRFSDSSYAACRELGLEPVYWSGWGFDWEAIRPDRIAELAIRDLEPGAILLLHDSPRYADRASARPTAEALPAIAEAARERGLELGPVGAATRSSEGPDAD
jgi:peptidoglycan/xylan/chitin deacetylase (PgdA/CDA1 family)